MIKELSLIYKYLELLNEMKIKEVAIEVIRFKMPHNLWEHKEVFFYIRNYEWKLYVRNEDIINKYLSKNLRKTYKVTKLMEIIENDMKQIEATKTTRQRIIH